MGRYIHKQMHDDGTANPTFPGETQGQEQYLQPFTLGAYRNIETLKYINKWNLILFYMISISVRKWKMPIEDQGSLQRPGKHLSSQLHCCTQTKPDLHPGRRWPHQVLKTLWSLIYHWLAGLQEEQVSLMLSLRGEQEEEHSTFGSQQLRKAFIGWI